MCILVFSDKDVQVLEHRVCRAMAEIGGNIDQVVIITADGEKLEIPDHLWTHRVRSIIPVSYFTPGELNVSYCLVVNGGRAKELVPTLLKLERMGVPYRVVELQNLRVETIYDPIYDSEM